MSGSMFSAARLTKHGNIVTCLARGVYPALFEPQVPKGEKDQTKAKYGIVLLIPKGSDIKALNEALATAAKEKFGRTKGVKSPIKSTEESKSLAKYSEEYPTYLRAQSNYRPQVTGPDGRTFIMDPEAAYSGRWCVCSIVPFAWSHPTGGDGVSLSLNSVQLLDHADRIGGTNAPVDDEFIPYEIKGGDAPSTAGMDDDDGFLS